MFSFSEWLHWLVVNIPSDQNIDSGQVLSEYMGPAPPKGSGQFDGRLFCTILAILEGPHRYVLLVYEQPEALAFEIGGIQQHCENISFFCILFRNSACQVLH